MEKLLLVPIRPVRIADPREVVVSWRLGRVEWDDVKEQDVKENIIISNLC